MYRLDLIDFSSNRKNVKFKIMECDCDAVMWKKFFSLKKRIFWIGREKGRKSEKTEERKSERVEERRRERAEKLKI